MDAQNIFLVGLMAVGKSTVGRQLAEALAMPFLMRIMRLSVELAPKSPGFSMWKANRAFAIEKRRLSTI